MKLINAGNKKQEKKKLAFMGVMKVKTKLKTYEVNSSIQ